MLFRKRPRPSVLADSTGAVRTALRDAKARRATLLARREVLESELSALDEFISAVDPAVEALDTPAVRLEAAVAKLTRPDDIVEVLPSLPEGFRPWEPGQPIPDASAVVLRNGEVVNPVTETILWTWSVTPVLASIDPIGYRE